MKVLHVLAGGGIGGIESLMNDYSRISLHENYFLFLWNGGEIFDEMVRAGVRAEVWNISKKDYLFVPFRILSLTKKEQIDVIVTHHPAPLIHVSNLVVLYFNKRIKSYTYLHSSAEDAFRVNSKKAGIIRLILKRSYLSSQRTIAISEYVANSLVDMIGISRDKISVIYNGVDTNKFKAVGCESVEQDKDSKLRIIYVGRLEKVKGIQNILRVLSKTNVSYSFSIVGDGSYRDELENQIDKLGIKDKVEFLGKRRDVSSLLNQSDVFIHFPNWQEGFGITVIEAMSVGCICIVNNHGALPEIIQNGVNGYVVPANDDSKAVEIISDLSIRRTEMFTPGSALYEMKIMAKSRAEDFRIENFTNELDKSIETL